jgi:GT2 family glycosyltransferase
MARPDVDVVVPFAGPASARAELEERVAGLRLRPGDTAVVVDNSPRPGPPSRGDRPRVLHAAARRTPGYARNRGAALGRSEWIVFFDADVEPPADLVDRYFDPEPGGRTGLLAGGLADEQPREDGQRLPAAARYAAVREPMSQDSTFAHGEFAFAQTANCAVRRSAFEAVGGFREELRAAEDADLCYRLAAAGFRIERREHARAVHRSRRSVRALLVQNAFHGAGAAWLDRAYPGSFPARRRPGLVWWALRSSSRNVWAAARRGDRDEAVLAVLDPLTTLAFEFGRSLPNERRARRAA